MTADLECPHCGGQDFTDYGDGLVACQRCYVQFDLNEQQCPDCGSLLGKDAAICLKCGADLRGDLARRTIRESLMTRNDRLRQRLSHAQRARVKEEKASRQRLDGWWEEERERQAEEHQKDMARQHRGRNLLLISAAIIVALVLLIILINRLLNSSTPPDPTPTTLLLLHFLKS